MIHRAPLPHRFLIPLLITVLLLTPALARAGFGTISIADEKEIGRKFDQTIRKQLTFVDDPEVTAYVKSVVDRVAAGIPPQPWPIKSAVVANGSMNAFAVPGGYVYIFTGLILGVNNEDELAAVISHELGHVTQHHVIKRMQQMKYISLASLAGLVAGVLLGAGGGAASGNLGMALATGSMAGNQSAFLMYTRENEREADNVGLSYLIKAGYNPNAMPMTFKLMQRKQWFLTSSTIPSYLATHPGLDVRIDYLRERIKDMPADIVSRPFQTKRFRRIQTILRARLTSADTALAYFDAIPASSRTCLDMVGRGIALERLRRMREAGAAFSAALACSPDDPLVLREAGIFYFNRGEFDKAAPYLQKAAIMNPGDAMALFYFARLLDERKDYAGAAGTMLSVIRKVPKDAEVRFYYSRILGEAGDLFGANLQMAYSHHYNHEDRKADLFLHRARALAKTEDQKHELAALEKAMGKKKPGHGPKGGGKGGPGGGAPHDGGRPPGA